MKINEVPQIVFFNLKEAKVLWTTMHEPEIIEVQRQGKTAQLEKRTLTVSLGEKDDDNYTNLMKAIKQACSSLTEKELDHKLFNPDTGKIRPITQKQADLFGLTTRGFRVKLSTTRPVKLLDWTKGQSKEQAEFNVSNGDIVSVRASVAYRKANIKSYIATGFNTLALVERGGSGDDMEGFFDENTSDEGDLL